MSIIYSFFSAYYHVLNLSISGCNYLWKNKKLFENVHCVGAERMRDGTVKIERMIDINKFPRDCVVFGSCSFIVLHFQRKGLRSWFFFWFRLQCQSMAFLFFLLYYTIVSKQFSSEWQSVNDECKDFTFFLVCVDTVIHKNGRFKEENIVHKKMLCLLFIFWHNSNAYQHHSTFINKSVFVFSLENLPCYD